MTCRSDECCQGRKPCPTPHVCSDAPLYAPLRHSTEDAIGYECAIPIVTDELKPIRRIRFGWWMVIPAAVAAWGLVRYGF